MASKVDKEALIKHRFWICLGVMAPLVLIALIVVMVSASDEIEASRKAFDGSVSALKGIKENPPNPSWVEILEDRDKQASAKKKEIWEAAWNSQAEDFTSWPVPGPGKAWEADPRALVFGTELSLNDRALYIDDDMYSTQLKPIIDIVQPVEEGVGVVQFKSDPMTMIRHVEVWTQRPPTSEDVWLAQEDLWVQKALLKIIREANDGIANLREVSKLVPDKAKGEVQRSRFLNTAWQLDLAVATGAGGRPVLRGVLRNLTIHRQFLGINFRVLVRSPDAADGQAAPKKDELLGEEVIKVEGEPLNPNQSIVLPEQPLNAPYVPGAKLAVQQVIDWRSAAVKRIDKIALGEHSHRTKNDSLQPAEVFAKAQGASESKGGEGGRPGGGAGGVGGGAALPGGKGAGRGDGGKTANGLERNRYTYTNPQVRRMPVGLLLVVDQAYLQEVLTAVGNSNMRIQVTQMEWQHYRGPDIAPKVSVNRPARTVDKKPGAGGGPPKPGGAGAGNVGGGPPKPGAGQPAGKPAATASEAPSDLVELAVYGIASLYERYREDDDKPGRPAGKAGK